MKAPDARYNRHMNILIVEDDNILANQLHETLEKEHYQSLRAATIKEAKLALEERDFDLVLLDWNLPDGDGIELLRSWRAIKLPTPVLVLSAKSSINERVYALDAGADDYLCKPYSNLELLARLRALGRREAPVKSAKIRVEDVMIDLLSHEVYVTDTPIKLSQAEFDLLTLLFQHQDMVLSRFQLNEHICKDFDRITQSNLVDVHIKNIRKKLGRPHIISTVRGVGYSVRSSTSTP